MKCLNCGAQNEFHLCEHCRTEEILDKIFVDLCFYKPDKCENPYVVEFAGDAADASEARSCIPQILALFDGDLSDYYFCRYYRICRDPLFEGAAISFLSSHTLKDFHAQRVLHDLLDSYLRNDYIKPRKWCDQIAATEHLCCELYADAAQYYAMIGEYDCSDQLVEKALGYCGSDSSFTSLFRTREEMISRLEKQKADTYRYRTVKPYWPNTEERRRAVAMFYDERGIAYPRITSRPQKVREEDFRPIQEYDGPAPVSYCTFRCEAGYSIVTAKCLYQIAAVKVENGRQTGQFQSYVRVWDGVAARRAAASAAGVPIEQIESADDVDLVISRFFEFVGSDILVAAEALGEQARLLVRAARYSGLAQIKNPILDLLDVAADRSPEFDGANNSREYLMARFGITPGKDALQKATADHLLYQKLNAMGD